MDEGGEMGWEANWRREHTLAALIIAHHVPTRVEPGSKHLPQTHAILTGFQGEITAKRLP